MVIKKAILLLSLMPCLCLATIYQWQDEQGQTHYGQEPPPNVKATELHPKVAPATTNTQPAAQTKEEKPAESPTAATAQKDAVDAKNKEAMKVNCERAKTFLQQLESKPRIRLQEPSGQVTALSEEQRSQQIEKTKEAVKLYCNEAK